MTDQYYTASEAQQRLGLSKAMFFRKVKQGFIRKVVPPGMKQGVYPRRDIDGLALSMQMLFEQDQGITFGRSMIADQIEELEIGARAFGRNFITPLPERILFQQKNEFTFHSLKVEGTVVGYISMFFFSDEVLDQLLTGKKIEREIKVSDVQPFPRLEPFTIYIDVMVIDPALSSHLRTLFAGILISRFADLLLHLRSNGYLFDKIYTVTSSSAGEKLVRKLGFQELEHKSLVPARVPFVVPFDQEHLHALQVQQHKVLSFARR
ncbi:hypothetical protein KDH_07840 [Dictyobacter sp. S3.2.2.5]|uniref:HTH merR-type domain-containing protein n=1 Tax=Dictyobacter halimunensis TaxID=3026934 RepID=A0ABQ6FJW5_9CHLR|nr:hypothetical protein KDH_07840 [Dictyobacter sp. S3.2.2.5]